MVDRRGTALIGLLQFDSLFGALRQKGKKGWTKALGFWTSQKPTNTGFLFWMGRL